MSSVTKANLKKKRRQQRRNSLLKILRLLLLAMLLWFIGWGGYHVYMIGADAYRRWTADYNEYAVRREQREAGWDARYQEYTNLLCMGVDRGQDEAGPSANMLLLISMHNDTGRLNLLAIPRGTIVPMASGELIPPRRPGEPKYKPEPPPEAAAPQSPPPAADASWWEKAKYHGGNFYDVTGEWLSEQIKEEEPPLVVIPPPRDPLPPPPQPGQAIELGRLYTYGGPSAVATAVNDLLEVSVHQYVALDVQTAAKLIDLAGGIDVYVPQAMHYEDPEQELVIHIDRGYSHMNGKMAMQYLRYRGDDLGDIGRIERQQQFMKAFHQKMAAPGTLLKLPNILRLIDRYLDTDMEVWDLPRMAKGLRCLEENPPKATLLPGQMVPGHDRQWQPDMAGIARRRDEMFPPPPASPDK